MSSVSGIPQFEYGDNKGTTVIDKETFIIMILIAKIAIISKLACITMQFA